MIFVRCPFMKSVKCIDNGEKDVNGNELVKSISFKTGVPQDLLVVYNGCHQILPNSLIPNGTTVYCAFALHGGKGGFGSMLRAIGAQIEKTTNREACRDLSGRRLRDINEEQRLKKWLAKKAEREAESERRRKERLERLKHTPKHDFHDPEYNKQRSELTERIDDALSAGLKKAKPVLGKKEAEETAEPSAKKPRLWLGVDVSSDSDMSEGETSVKSSIEGSSSAEDTVPPAESCHRKENESKETSCHITLTDDLQSETNSASAPDTKSHFDSIQSDEMDKEPSKEIEQECSKDACHSSETKQFNENSNMEITKDDVMTFSSPAELEKLGLEKLKTFLMNLGLKCGGTLAERAQRVWSIRGLDPKDYPPSVKAKPKK